MDFTIDRNSGIPVWRQICGTIRYAIACGDLSGGDPLPSIRELADQLGVASMTINQVYTALKREGLIDARRGAGSFVADNADQQAAIPFAASRLREEIEKLIDCAAEAGIQMDELPGLVAQRVSWRAAHGKGPTIAIVGLFVEATRRYARQVAQQMGAGVVVYPVTLDEINGSASVKARVDAADLVVTIANMRLQVAAMFPGTRVVGLRFIPSEETRLKLASIDPRAKVAVVSKFADFLPILRAGVRRFAPHVHSLVAMNIDDPQLGERLEGRDVVIHASGAEDVRGFCSSRSQLVEYGYILDPGDMEKLVRPIAARVTDDAREAQ